MINDRIRSFLSGKCPSCRTGKLFKGAPYSRDFLKMHKNCPHCERNLEREPGFYWGAFFISYGIVTGLVLSQMIFFYFAGWIRNDLIFLIIPLVVLLLSPLIFQYSRIIFLYLFGGIRFDNN